MGLHMRIIGSHRVIRLYRVWVAGLRVIRAVV